MPWKKIKLWNSGKHNTSCLSVGNFWESWIDWQVVLSFPKSVHWLKCAPKILSWEHTSSKLLVKLGFYESPFQKTLIKGFCISLLTTHETSVNLSTESLYFSQRRTRSSAPPPSVSLLTASLTYFKNPSLFHPILSNTLIIFQNFPA